MPRGVHIENFQAKLKLALAQMNMSRSRLAQKLAVDKSAVSRWMSGQVQPTEHHLANITKLVRGEIKGFTRAEWDRDLASFTARIGITPEQSASLGVEVAADGSPAQVIRPWKTLEAGRRHGGRLGHVYEGHWRMFRMKFAHDGSLSVNAVEIMRRDGGLAFRYSDGHYDYAGEVFILGGQLYFLGEESERHDELFLMILNSVNWPDAGVLDGVMTGVAGDPGHTPGAMRTILEYRGERPADPAENEALWRDYREIALHDATNGEAADAERRFGEALRCRIDWRQDTGGGEHFLRVPLSRSLSKGRSEP